MLIPLSPPGRPLMLIPLSLLGRPMSCLVTPLIASSFLKTQFGIHVFVVCFRGLRLSSELQNYFWRDFGTRRLKQHTIILPIYLCNYYLIHTLVCVTQYMVVSCSVVAGRIRTRDACFL